MADLSILISDQATRIDESVNSLSGDIEEQKNKTTSELADLHTSIQSSIITTADKTMDTISNSMDLSLNTPIY